MSLKNLSFQAKLTIGAVVVVAVAVVMMAASNLYQVRKSLHQLAGTSIESFADGMFAAMELQYAMLDQKVRVDVTLVKNAIDDMGLVRLNKFSKNEATIVNQITGEAEEAEFYDMEVAGTSLYHNYEVVDEVQNVAGGTATIFQMLPGKLLRIATNVKKLDGERAVGTYIPQDSPVFRAIAEGKPYFGIAYVVNDWFQTAYLPLRDPRDRIIGAIYVGRKIITPEFRKLIESSNIGGKGYSFIYNKAGKLLIHPSIEGQNISDYSFWSEFAGVEDGIVRYTYGGEEKVAYLKYFPAWGWTYGFTMEAGDMLHGVDKKLLVVSGISAVVAFVLAVLFIFGLIRNLTKPLKKLSGYTDEVARGDYNARIEYAADDVIGDTITSVRNMTYELKNKLGVSEGLLNGLTIPCIMVDLDDRITYVNQHELDMVQKSGTPEDYVGMSLSEFFHGEKGRDTLTAKAMREDTVLRGVEIENIGARGRKYYAQVDSSPLKDLDGKLIGGFSIIKDFTAIKEGEERIRQQADQVTRVAAEADVIAEQLASASEELSVKVQESSRGAQVQLDRSTETSSAMEQMNATVLEVAKNASEVAENAGRAKGKAQEGAELVSKVVRSIGDLADHSQVLKESMSTLGKQTDDIGAIMQVIEDIADQTNLLALNAAIEAARAGEAGRGFAVVADEVRKLAEKTMQATKEVGSAIGSIQSGTRQNIEATETAVESIESSTELAGLSGQALQEIVEMVEHTAQQVTSIATAAEEQSATSEQINRATEEINVISSENSQAMGEANVALTELAELAAKLKELISTMRS